MNVDELVAKLAGREVVDTKSDGDVFALLFDGGYIVITSMTEGFSIICSPEWEVVWGSLNI